VSSKKEDGSGAHQRKGFEIRNPSLSEVKAMLLMADIVNQLSNNSVHSGSNQTLKKEAAKLATFICLLYKKPPL